MSSGSGTNLLWEFRIAEKNEAMLMKKKKAIFVKSTANLNFSSKSEKPGAINL